MAMDEMNEKERVRYYVEVMTATMERTIRRLWILCIVLVALLLATNAGWLWYESQFEDVVITPKQSLNTIAAPSSESVSQAKRPGECGRSWTS